MKTVAFVLSMVVAVVWAGPQGGLNYQPPVQPQYVTPRPQYAPVQPQYADEPAQYSFQYTVNDEYSGNHFGHEEYRDGDNTQGRYYVLLPDGRTQKVEYTADAYGYHPIVTYEGVEQYYNPSSQGYSPPAPSPRPVYV